MRSALRNLEIFELARRATALVAAVLMVAIPVGPGAVFADEVGGEDIVVDEPAPMYTPPPPAPAPPMRPSGKKWGAHVDLRTKLGSRFLGRGDLFIPLWQDPETLTFLDLRVMGDDEENIEGNFGLAARKLLNSWIVGGYGFFDIRRSDEFGTENTYIGGTLGIEGMSEDFDVRANAYIPDDEKKNNPNATKATFSGGRILIRNGIERALYGGDAEIGVRIPFADDSALWDTRLYAGGYYFDAGSVDSVGGPRGRFETRLHDIPYMREGSRLVLGGEVSWDEVRDVTALGLVQLRIPLGGGGHGSGPGGKLTKLERRMLDPIVREVDIITRPGRSGSEAALNPKTHEEITAVEVARLGEETSTPIQDAIDAAGANNVVVVDGGSDPFMENVYLENGQILVGGGGDVFVYGRDAGMVRWTAPGSRPTLVGDTYGPGYGGIVHLARDNYVGGIDFDMTNFGGFAAIFGHDIGNAMVNDSRFWGFRYEEVMPMMTPVETAEGGGAGENGYGNSRYGIKIAGFGNESDGEFEGANHLTVMNSHFENFQLEFDGVGLDETAGGGSGTGGSGYGRAAGIGLSGNVDADILGNSFLYNEYGVYAEVKTYGNSQAFQINPEEGAGGGQGDWLNGFSMPQTLNVNIVGNRFEENASGIGLKAKNAGFLTANIQDNFFQYNGVGVDLYVKDYTNRDALSARVDVSANSFVENDTGLDFTVKDRRSGNNGASSLRIETNVDNNSFERNYIGLDAYAENGAYDTDGSANTFSWMGNVTGNRFVENYDGGGQFEYYVNDSDLQGFSVSLDWRLSNNLFRRSGFNPESEQSNDADGFNFYLSGYAENAGNLDVSLDVTGNRFVENGEDGFDLDVDLDTDSDSNWNFGAWFLDNQFADNGEAGLDLDMEADFDSEVDVFGNNFSGGQYGIAIGTSDDTSFDWLVIGDNRIDGADVGIRIDADFTSFSSEKDGVLGNNVITNSISADYDFSGSFDNDGSIRINGEDLDVED